MAQPVLKRGEMDVTRAADGALVVRLRGAWTLETGLPPLAEVERALMATPRPTRVGFDVDELGRWDSSLIGFVIGVAELARERKVPVDVATLPDGVRRLVALVEAVPERPAEAAAAPPPSTLARIGQQVVRGWHETLAMLAFIGEVATAVGRLLRGRARVRARDFWVLVQEAGADALAIITLISFLVGTIFAFVGAVQLQQFGATIYVADLVGIATVRETGAMMTGIVLAGRTGAAYAAQLGTMRVTQEIDALTTMGINPIDFLVLPRLLALSLMMPLLCLYADAVSVLGGAFIGVFMLHIGPLTYFHETFHAVSLGNLFGGILKASVYGVLVAVSGCLRGLESGRSAAAVGEAATSAVVTSIVLIIVACGLFAVVFWILGI
jgi:phospholipid/cholesterol/gamma-HCH transport system permease protein